MLIALERAAVHYLTRSAVTDTPPHSRRVTDDSPLAEETVDHALWSSILSRCVVREEMKEGITCASLFDYELARTDVSVQRDMSAYLELLASAPTSSLNDNELCALLINAYNVFAVKLVLDAMGERRHGTALRSINNISTWRQAVWKKRAGIIGGRAVCLDEIEHGMLRHEWAEPRIHACIVCASLR